MYYTGSARIAFVATGVESSGVRGYLNSFFVFATQLRSLHHFLVCLRPFVKKGHNCISSGLASINQRVDEFANARVLRRRPHL
jgi:hypothetical protein